MRHAVTRATPSLSLTDPVCAQVTYDKLCDICMDEKDSSFFVHSSTCIEQHGTCIDCMEEWCTGDPAKARCPFCRATICKLVNEQGTEIALVLADDYDCSYLLYCAN